MFKFDEKINQMSNFMENNKDFTSMTSTALFAELDLFLAVTGIFLSMVSNTVAQ